MGNPGATEPEYDDAMVGALELIWGEGFLSPGGPEEVAEILRGLDIVGRDVLDIGCGIGGIDLILARDHGAGSVLGIDIEAPNVARAQARAAACGLEGTVSYQTVTPGPLPFADARFDVVFSKDAIIHIPDKEAFFRDVFRILKPGGLFAASDWLRGDDDAPSAAMDRYVALEGLSFAMASPARYATAMERAGFAAVELSDRNQWYRQLARSELAAISGPLKDRLEAIVGKDERTRQTRVWEAMLAVLDTGELRPTHLRGAKPS